MATFFEIYICHPDPHYAGQAASAAFEEVDRLELELSRYIENSDISRINNSPANRPIKVSLAVFDCLKQCAKLYRETNGVFDITIGPLLVCWRDENKQPTTPTKNEIEQARQRTGFHHIHLNEKNLTVLLKTAPMQLDMGGFGKGYALDKAAELLQVWDIEIALLHSGHSTVLALDPPPTSNGWKLTIRNPDQPDHIIDTYFLKNRSLSGSGIRKGQHIIDPRTAQPVRHTIAAWSSASTAATADALSTAFMILKPKEIEQYCKEHPDTHAIVFWQEDPQDNKSDSIKRY